MGDPARYVLPHGTLAVDFFFGLSRFGIGYAYDGRWGRMSTAQFPLRRVIRLHPLVLLATLLGAARPIRGRTTASQPCAWRSPSPLPCSCSLLAVLG